jgi:peptidyl-dipeptidase Dcp
VAFDRAGALHRKIYCCFSNLCSSNGIPELQAVETKMAGPLAAHENKVYTLPGLFSKIDTVHQARHTLALSREQLRLVERVHLDFVRSGARFGPADQARYAAITEEMAQLETQFTQNLLADESEITIQLSNADLVGLPPDLVAAARQAALDRKVEGDDAHIITLSRSLVEPFITYSERRDLREKAWKLWTSRGELDPKRDNLAVARAILALRAEQAKMHGYETFGHYATADTMAGTPDRVMELLEKVWNKGKESINRERKELETYISAHETSSTAGDAGVTIEPWDWRYYEEKVRQSCYNMDESEAKPYFALDRMLEAIFDVAHELFGLTFKHRPDIAAYHPDVKVYEVHQGEGGPLVAMFLSDNYARQHKRSGAWMSEFRTQCRDGDERIVPIVVNNNNFNKGKAGEPTLLSFDDARTLFHEFGHGLHGMLSDVAYQRLAGTSVLRDFVELPSQLYEHWLSQEKVLQKHARHHASGEVIPAELMERMNKARRFGQGFATIEYTASALVDAALHKAKVAEGAEVLDIAAFEKTELERLGMPQGIVMRHRPAHFSHLFSSSSYASAYYVYLWAEVLDADGFDAFLEAGDCFDAATAERVRKYIYSAGNSYDPAEAFRLFRGRDPAIEPMLKKKGLLLQ